MKSCLFIFIFASLWGSCRNRYPSERMLNQAAQLIYSSPQQALKLQQEQNKQKRKARKREQKQLEAERMFELKQQKKKEKHKGH